MDAKERKINNLTAMRSIYYPPITGRLAEIEGVVRCGEHSDYGTITLLYQVNLDKHFENFLTEHLTGHGRRTRAQTCRWRVDISSSSGRDYTGQCGGTAGKYFRKVLLNVFLYCIALY